MLPFRKVIVGLESETLLHGLHFLESLGANRLVAFRAFHLSAYFNIEFNLGFRAGRTDTDFRTVGSEPLQYVARSGEVEIRGVPFSVGGFERLVVFGADYRRTGDFFRSMRTEVVHHGFDFVSSALTGLHDIDRVVQRETIFEVDVHEHIEEGLALILCPCTDFCKQGAG